MLGAISGIHGVCRLVYYADLTPYQYMDSDESQDLPILNIGWLTKAKLYSIGKTSEEFKEKLLSYCFFEKTVFNCLGYHICQFCAVPQAPILVKRGEHTAYLGNGEIRVRGNVAIYAAPTLIYHYVVTHDYKPPDEFIDAVLIIR